MDDHTLKKIKPLLYDMTQRLILNKPNDPV